MEKNVHFANAVKFVASIAIYIPKYSLYDDK